MLPLRSGGNRLLTGLTRGGAPVSFTVSVDQGRRIRRLHRRRRQPCRDLRRRRGRAHGHRRTPAAGATRRRDQRRSRVRPSARRSTRRRCTGGTFELRTAANALVARIVSYDAGDPHRTPDPECPAGASTTYTATLRGGGIGPARQGSGRQSAGGNRQLDLHQRRRRPHADCPCGAWTAVRCRSSADVGPERGRARREVPRRRRRLHHRHPLLQGDRQHRNARRQPVDGERRPARHARPSPTRSASGWQQVNFATPVAITANTIYVASYFAPNGRYAADGNFFAQPGRRQRADPPAARRCRTAAMASTPTARAAASRPSTFSATNYWVDVVFSTTATVGRPHATDGDEHRAGARRDRRPDVQRQVTATFSEAMDPASISTGSFELRTRRRNALVAASVALQPGHPVATLTPAAPLAPPTTYVATMRGGGIDPRVEGRGRQSRWRRASPGRSPPARPAARCAAPANPIVARELPDRQPGQRMGRQRRRRSQPPGLRHPDQRQPRQHRLVQGRHHRQRYRFDIYRLGYYGGLGARKVATVNAEREPCRRPSRPA